MLQALRNIWDVPDLRRRVLFTLGLLAVYRVGNHVPTPGINAQSLIDFFEQNRGNWFGLVDMFSGGNLAKVTIFALGIMPYISASIILQLLTVVWPFLEKLSKEGELGRRKITQYTRYGTVLLSVIQSFGIAVYLERMTLSNQFKIVEHPGWSFKFMTVLTLTTGTAFIMWLGEQITERGIGNGISLIIFAGIVTDMPDAAVRMFSKAKTGDITAFDLAVIGVLIVLVVAVIIFFERGQRRIPVQYAKRVVGRKIVGGQSSHLPLKVNTAGVIPPIFASSILMFPQQIASFVQTPWMQRISEALHPGDWRYNLLYVGLIVFFCYFYTAVTFNPVDVADNMKKYGGFIPGIRPGRATAAYINKVLTRITFGGAVYISAICVLPSLLHEKMKVPFYFGGTGLMIVVGVALDTVQQIESHLITRNYEGFTGPRGPRIRGRGGRGTGAVSS